MDESMDCAPSTRVGTSEAGTWTMFCEVFQEFVAICMSEEPTSQLKDRFSALRTYADAQGLTGRTAFYALQRLLQDHRGEFMDTGRFSTFYRFVYFILRERNQKSLSVDMALEAWRLVLTGRFRLLDQWCAFVAAHQRHAISEDSWRQVLDFSRSVHEDLSNYDPGGAWPVLVDDFVDCMYRRMGRASKLPCPKCQQYSADSAGGEVCATCHPETGPSLMQTNSGSWSMDSENGNINRVGVVAAAGSKRRRDPIEEAAEAESINCIAQRLAAMDPPADSGTGSDTDSDTSDFAKRLRVEDTDPMLHRSAAVHPTGPSRFSRRQGDRHRVGTGGNHIWGGSPRVAPMDDLGCVNQVDKGGAVVL